MPSPAPPRARRDLDHRWVAGVCSGLAENLRWPVPLVRVAFMVLTLANGLGVVAYLIFWVVMPARTPADIRQTHGEFPRMLGFGVTVIGLSLLAYVWGWGAFRTFLAPLLVLVVGLAIIWQERIRSGGDSGSAADGTGPAWVRTALGGLLIAAGLWAVVVGEVGWQQSIRAMLVVLLLVAGGVVLVLPWLLRAFRDLDEERTARIRERERTELATQVHDSVLQTLTLIQRHADDPEQVRRLSRSEERHLRSWLYSPADRGPGTIGAALRAAASRVEADYDATVDVVVVGEADLGASGDALVAAATEAMVNSAKHAGPRARVSVFCEVGEGVATVFVRDRGPGFDPETIPEDRRGVRDSMRARLEKVQGSVTFTIRPDGTQVELTAPLVDA